LHGAAQELLDMGALRYVQKPFYPADLASAVAKALKV
jgi:DNA-binding response OmpR family regulator